MESFILQFFRNLMLCFACFMLVPNNTIAFVVATVVMVIMYFVDTRIKTGKWIPKW